VEQQIAARRVPQRDEGRAARNSDEIRRRADLRRADGVLPGDPAHNRVGSVRTARAESGLALKRMGPDEIKRRLVQLKKAA
jgi:hypothetical protein